VLASFLSMGLNYLLEKYFDSTRKKLLIKQIQGTETVYNVDNRVLL